MDNRETNNDSRSETPSADGAKTPPVTPATGKNIESEMSLQTPEKQKEIGGRDGPDPTRFGDWENKGRCVDF